MTTATVSGGQIGRSLPRLSEGRGAAPGRNDALSLAVAVDKRSATTTEGTEQGGEQERLCRFVFGEEQHRTACEV